MLEINHKCDKCGINTPIFFYHIYCEKCHRDLETEKEEYLDKSMDSVAKIEGLEYENRKIKDENEYLLKRIEDLEDNLCPSCARK